MLKVPPPFCRGREFCSGLGATPQGAVMGEDQGRLHALSEAWLALPEDVRAALSSSGARLERPDLIQGMAESEEDAQQWAEQLIETYGLGYVDALDLGWHLWLLVVAATSRAGSTRRQRISIAAEDLSIDQASSQRMAAGSLEGDREAQRILRSADTGSSKPKRERRTRRAKQLARLADDPKGRQEVEEHERMRWVTVLIMLIVDAGLPRAKSAELTQDPVASMARCAGPTRARTIRARVRQFKKMRDWLFVVHTVVWPQHVGQVLDYLEMLAAEPCGRSVPRSVLAAPLSFVEEKDEVPEEDRISTCQILKTTVADMEAQLSSSAQPTHKAPSLFVMMVIAMELLVLDESMPSGARAMSWVKLLKVWSSLRSDDLRGLLPAELKCNREGLHGWLDRTKTSGPGRRIRWLPVTVSAGAYLAHPSWLQAGYDIWNPRPLNFERGYFVMPMDETLQQVRHAPANYEDMARMSYMVYMHLRRPLYCDGGWRTSEELLFQGQEAPHWTEHSERNLINNVAATMGYPKSERDFLGRWVPQQSDDYLRTARSITHKLQ